MGLERTNLAEGAAARGSPFLAALAASKAMRGAAGRPLPVLPFQLDAANRRS